MFKDILKRLFVEKSSISELGLKEPFQALVFFSNYKINASERKSYTEIYADRLPYSSDKDFQLFDNMKCPDAFFPSLSTTSFCYCDDACVANLLIPSIEELAKMYVRFIPLSQTVQGKTEGLNFLIKFLTGNHMSVQTKCIAYPSYGEETPHSFVLSVVGEMQDLKRLHLATGLL